MQEKIIKLTAVFTGIFTVCVILAMVLYQVKRPQLQVIESGKQADIQSTIHASEQTQNIQNRKVQGTSVRVTDGTAQDQTFHLILSEDVPEQDESTVALDVDYVNKMVLVTLQNISERELEGCQILADPLVVVSKEVTVTSIPGQTDGCVIMIPETEYETCQLEMKQGEIAVTFDKLGPSSACTVVIDAGHGGDDTGTELEGLLEKDLSLGVVEQLQLLLDKQNDSMRIFYTRTGDVTVSDSDRVAFANEIKADMLISLHINLQPAQENGLQAFYNDTYFIPEFGSIELANVMEEEVIQKIGGVATGLYPADPEDTIIRNAKVPAVKMEIDSACTENDLEIMKTESYQKQIAEGIYAGIMRSFQEMSKEEISEK